MKTAGPAASGLILGPAMLMCVAGVTQARTAPEGPLRVHGYAQTQVGVFVSTDKDEVEEYRAYPGAPVETFPSNHGGLLGKLSMFRTTVFIDAHWEPKTWFGAHLSFRGVVGPPLSADSRAQLPHIPGYVSAARRREEWVARHFYNRAEFRQVYVDVRPQPCLALRIGRQLVHWGEAGLLDVVNPVDGTWHFAALESFRDVRIPLWMVRLLLDVEALRGGLDLVWVPMVPWIERPEDTVTVPLTMAGAWGLPPAPRQGDASVSSNKIRYRKFLYPRQHPKESRIGVRWLGEVGPVAYSLVYYYGHQSSPPVPRFYKVGDFRGVDVELDFPRLHQLGFSAQYIVPFPLDSILRFELLFEPNRTFPMYSELKELYKEPTPDDPTTVARFKRKRRPVLTYALTLQQPIVARFLNPLEPLIMVVVFQHSFLPGFKPATQEDCASFKGECILQVPGYDSTLMRRHHFKLAGRLFTSYFHGLLRPGVAFAYLFAENEHGRDFKDGGALLGLALDLAPDTHFRIRLAVNQFFGSDPYYGLGFFRDRDEVNIRVRYQF